MGVSLPLAGDLLFLYLRLHGGGERPHRGLQPRLSLFLLLEEASKVVRKICLLGQQAVHLGIVLNRDELV